MTQIAKAAIAGLALDSIKRYILEGVQAIFQSSRGLIMAPFEAECKDVFRGKPNTVGTDD